jgi:inositol transport system substrate-binding protein
MFKKIITACLCCILISLCMTSCKKNSSSKIQKPVRIGISMAHYDDIFLSYLRESMYNYKNKVDNLEITSQDAKGDVGKQLSNVENYIALEMDAIIVNPVDTLATRKMTRLAVEAGIPIIYVNRMPEEKLPEGAYFVGSDEEKAGRLQMQYLAEKMNGKGNLAIMLGELSSVGTHGRTKGVKDVLKKYPDIHIVEEQTAKFMRDQALNLMSNWLSSGKKIDAVAANNDEMALGAILAMKNIGIKPNKDILVGGVDANPDALEAMKKDELTVTVFQDAKGQGEGAVKVAYKLSKGGNNPSITWIPFKQVTEKNYKKFLD